METIAVYWEPVIRVYGFEVVEDVDLIRVRLPAATSHLLGQQISRFGASGASFVLVVHQYIDPQWVEICCVIKKKYHQDFIDILAEDIATVPGLAIDSQCGVEALFFHGPHFQDRYGIIAAAMEVVTDQGSKLHLAGCAGTSIYLITPAGAAEGTKKALAAAFTIPQHGGRAA